MREGEFSVLNLCVVFRITVAALPLSQIGNSVLGHIIVAAVGLLTILGPFTYVQRVMLCSDTSSSLVLFILVTYIAYLFYKRKK